MCHMSPATQSLGLLVFVVGALFIGWHIWCFDRGRCLLFTRRDAFRWVILMMLVASLTCMTTWSSILVYVKYTEYYTAIPNGEGGTSILPVPYQLWSESRQSLVRKSYHIASVGWGLLVSVHAEETLYWSYLIGSIRNRSSKTWFQSVQFKLWLLCVCSAIGLEIGVSNIETINLNEMEHYIFFTGSILATILFFGSTWLLVVFPGFIQESRRQGANPEVLGRLQYFKELNIARTVFRFVYAASLLTISIDAFTKRRFINAHSPFWLDVLFVMAYFGAVTSTAISILILLPRSMAQEAGVSRNIPVYINNANKYPRSPQQPSDSDLESFHPASPKTKRRAFGFRDHRDHRDSASPASAANNPWGKLGERLNIDKEHLEDLHASSMNSSEMFDLPFAARPGDRRLEAGEEIHHVPAQLDHFVSPLQVNTPPKPRELNIVVTTNTIVEKE